jgi:hypothetical protein
MKVLTWLLLSACALAPAQAQSPLEPPIERFAWRDGKALAQAQAQAQQYETYRRPWVEYRTKAATFQRSRRWQRLFVASSFAAIGGALVYSQSRAQSPSANSIRVASLGVSGGLLAFEFLTNRGGRRDKHYSLMNLGVAGGFAALTVHDQIRE